jgi:hypothetical protein
MLNEENKIIAKYYLFCHEFHCLDYKEVISWADNLIENGCINDDIFKIAMAKPDEYFHTNLFNIASGVFEKGILEAVIFKIIHDYKDDYAILNHNIIPFWHNECLSEEFMDLFYPLDHLIDDCYIVAGILYEDDIIRLINEIIDLCKRDCNMYLISKLV